MAQNVVNERGAIIATFELTDEDGNVSTPTAATWRLTDAAGVVINGRSSVSVTPSPTITIALSGDDTALRTPDDDGQRRLLLTATYNSSAGTGLLNVREFPFVVAGVAGTAPATGTPGQFTALWERVAALVPAQNGVPTTAQYQQAVKDAVADFGRRVPRRLLGTLAVVAGTASYAFPAGFQRLIKLEALGAEDIIRDGAGFLVPLSASWQERYTVDGATITFYPTPAYTLNRDYLYAAGYPYVAATDSFTGLISEYEPVVMLKAQAVALRALGVAGANMAGMSYRIGDTSVQRTVTQAHAQWASELDAAYLDACKGLVGYVGRRATYPPGSYA